MLGHDVRLAMDGEEVLSVAAEFRPEIAFLDIGMPKLNGYEAARRIREQPWGQSIRLVALTGWGQQGDLQRSQQAGFDAHIVKPASPEVLGKLLLEPERPSSASMEMASGNV